MEETNPQENSYDDDFVGPQVDPRVGDEYQAEIPPMMSQSEYLSLISLGPVSDSSSSSSCSLLMGNEALCIEEKGVEDDNFDLNESLRSLKAKGTRSCLKIKGGVDEITTERKEKSDLEVLMLKRPNSSWEEYEVDSFVLGLYTFGKNFTQVKKFMESKEIGEILFFYYGKFYKSVKYRRWSDSRKKRNRKCVCGMKLYSGWRQQQLLSLLIPGLPEESRKDKLLNVSKSFAERNTSLEKYIDALKELVGLRALVDAIGIGKGKEDLTIVGTEPTKTKQWFVVSSNQSVASCAGAYASLTSGDIIKELTGGCRLSKTRCSDIFWEAVWPRLLARGWRSEQPKDRGYVTSKDYLVFLIPGVNKFSRQKLVKGDHYFDSVSDILTKVASEPELLELEAKEIGAVEKPVEEDSSETSDREVSPCDSQRFRYLRSPCSNLRNMHMKFTVVDTSMAVVGGKVCELRELRSSDLETPASKSKACERESDVSVVGKGITHVDSKNSERFCGKNLVDDSMRFTIVDTSMDHAGRSSGLRRWRRLPGDEFREVLGNSFDGGARDDHVNVNSDAMPSENAMNRDRDEDRSKRVIKRKFVRRAESAHHVSNSVPLLKRRRLSACVKREISLSAESRAFKTSESDQPRDRPAEETNLKNEKKPEAVLLVNDSSSNPDGLEKLGNGLDVEGVREIRRNGSSSVFDSDSNWSLKEQGTSEERDQPRQVCSMSDLDKKCSSNDVETTRQHGSSSRQEQEVTADVQRRQSTRKRPLTTRALEALELGLYTTKKINKTAKPRKRQHSLKIKHSGSVCDKAEALVNNGGSSEMEGRADRRVVGKKKVMIVSKSLDQIEDSNHSFVMKKATTGSKPLDQSADSKPVISQVPRLPPIVWKLPPKPVN